MRVRTVQSVTLVLSIFVFVVPAAAADARESLRDCRKLIEEKQWSEAADAYLALFSAFPRDPVIIGEIRAIEDDLKRALFMRGYKEPKAKTLFGPSVKRFGKGSCKLVLVFKGKPDGPRWRKVPNDLLVLDIRFRDKLSVELDTRTVDENRQGIGILFCYDIEKRGGYLFRLGTEPNRQARIGNTARFLDRLDEGKRTGLYKDPTPEAPSPARYKLLREGYGIRFLVQNRQDFRVRDKTYKGGYLAFAGMFPDKLTVSGTLDRNFYNQLVGGIFDRAFREWQEKSYDRKNVLPEWALDPVAATSAMCIETLPSDAKGGDRQKTAKLVERCLNGDPKAAASLASLASRQPERTKTYLTAISEIGRGRMKSAETTMCGFIEEEPEFAPALAIRGFLRMVLRRIDDARKDFAAAREKCPELSMAWLGEVNLAIYDGDLERARAVVTEARAAGAMSTELADMPALLHRAQKGPLWSRRYQVLTKRFETKSDHSKDLCGDASHLLESALTSYRNHFPDIEYPDRKARVYVFSSRDGYLGYAEDRRRNLTHSAGMYDPSLRELLVYLPELRTEFVHTVRHEGFHRFLHEHLEAAPLWFNEGCAEYFASARESFGGDLIPGEPYRQALDFLGPRMELLTPLSELFQMDNRTFMQKAGLHYPQSWAIVHYLLKSKAPGTLDVLKDYFRSLREGLSKEEAYEQHLEPKLTQFENGYKRHIRSLL